MAAIQPDRANFRASDLVTKIDPTITGSAAVERAANAYAKGALTTEEILKSVGPRAHKAAQLEDLVMERQAEDILDPAKATGRKAVALQQEQAVQRALNAGAPIPTNEDGSVNFQGLFDIMPQVAQWERNELDRRNKFEEWQSEFKRFAATDPTKPREFHLSWTGAGALSPDQFNQIGREIRAPQTFQDMFTSGAGQAATGAAQGQPTVPPAVGGEVFPAQTQPQAQPVQQPAQQQQVAPQPMAPQPSQGGTAAGAAPQQPITPSQQAAGAIGWHVSGYSASGIPIYTDKDGQQRSPTEAEQKAILANARFVVTPLMQQIEDMGEQPGGFDVTGQGNGLRLWIADALPKWAPLVGHGSLSEPQQLYSAASRAWIQGILRQESGAAIPPEEEQSYYETYFAQPGDNRSVVLLKRAMRAELEAGIEGIVPQGKGQNVNAPIQYGELLSAAGSDVYQQGGNVLSTGATKGNQAAQRTGVTGFDAATGLPVVSPNSGTNNPNIVQLK